jgi:hypothetical protein
MLRWIQRAPSRKKRKRKKKNLSDNKRSLKANFLTSCEYFVLDIKKSSTSGSIIVALF